MDDNDALLLLQADSVPSGVKRVYAGSAISRVEFVGPLIYGTCLANRVSILSFINIPRGESGSASPRRTHTTRAPLIAARSDKYRARLSRTLMLSESRARARLHRADSGGFLWLKRATRRAPSVNSMKTN